MVLLLSGQAKHGRVALALCWLMAQCALAAQIPSEVEDSGDTLLLRGNRQAQTAATTELAGAQQPWVLAYFRQRYEGRVEIDAEGCTRQVPLPDPMKEEHLHLALSTDGRHWEPLNGNRPVWNQWLRDPFVGRGSVARLTAVEAAALRSSFPDKKN